MDFTTAVRAGHGDATREGQAPRILVIDDDADLCELLAASLRVAGFDVDTAGDVDEGLARLVRQRPSIAIVDVNLPGADGYSFLAFTRQRLPDLPVMMLSGSAGRDAAERAVAAGARGYLQKPVDFSDLTGSIRALLASSAPSVSTSGSDLESPQPARVPRAASAHDATAPILGDCAAIAQVRSLVAQVAPTALPVLIQGESGTGKELVARALHAASGRPGDFVAVNCAAVPDGLVESFLFGHERGAFTGALRRETGAFERAHRGTLLLDEITEMRPDLQAKLLRVLQEREVQRVGGRDPVPVDVRVVATTNRDPATAVAEHRLREDLLYRLDGIRLSLPPLRERADDIPTLAAAILTEAAAAFGRPGATLTAEACVALRGQAWPGNVRQLQHLLQRALLFAPDGRVGLPELQRAGANALSVLSAAAPGDVAVLPAGTPASGLPTLRLDLLQQLAIREALERCGGNRSHAAALLGLNVRSLRRILNADTPSEAR